MHCTNWAAAFALVLPVAGTQAAAPQPTELEFKEQIQRLERAKDKATRLESLRWFNRHAGADHAALALPALERCVRDADEMEVRRDAVLVLALIAKRRDKPCPLSVVEALLDKEDEVRWQAGASTALFQAFAPGSVEVLLRCARSENAGLRGDSLLILARAAGKDRKVLDTIEKAKQDRAFEVRHSAHCALFRATDRLDEFLLYILRVREDPDAVLRPAPEDAELRKRERAMRNLFLIGSSMQLIEWSEKRADELAPLLMKSLEDKSPVLRRGAANLIGATAVKVDLPASGKLEGDWFSKLAPYLEKDVLPDPLKKDTPTEKRPQKSRVATRLEKLQADSRLRKMRDNDPDRSVREAARFALDRLASVQEKKP